MKKIFCALISLFISVASWADVRVAFFQNRFRDGSYFAFEPGGRFFHTAVETPEGWLHVDGFKGVTISPHLPRVGNQVVVLNLNRPPLQRFEYEKYLGLKMDHDFTWDDPIRTGHVYCSQLIALVLKVQPRPLLQPNPKSKYQVGVSPDYLYQVLRPQSNDEATLPVH
jgi:hypothetical protein